jgi:ABC-type uncharacterized transport system permease subunit
MRASNMSMKLKKIQSGRIDRSRTQLRPIFDIYENSFSHSGIGQVFLSLSLIITAVGSEFPLNDNPGSTAGASDQI